MCHFKSETDTERDRERKTNDQLNHFIEPKESHFEFQSHTDRIISKMRRKLENSSSFEILRLNAGKKNCAPKH